MFQYFMVLNATQPPSLRAERLRAVKFSAKLTINPNIKKSFCKNFSPSLLIYNVFAYMCRRVPGAGGMRLARRGTSGSRLTRPAMPLSEIYLILILRKIWILINF